MWWLAMVLEGGFSSSAGGREPHPQQKEDVDGRQTIEVGQKVESLYRWFSCCRLLRHLERCLMSQSTSARSNPMSLPAFSDSIHLCFKISSRSAWNSLKRRVLQQLICRKPTLSFGQHNCEQSSLRSLGLPLTPHPGTTNRIWAFEALRTSFGKA